MSYDEELALRVRELIAAEKGLSETKMFGGLAFLIGGNMAIAASGEGGLLVRCDPGDTDELVKNAGATVAVMRGKAMPGWLRVDDSRVTTKRELGRWVKRGVTYARSLPAKR
ncbi:MAG: TfoX/Sxy family protein [Candidatus Dormibacteria bacterium]